MKAHVISSFLILIIVAPSIAHVNLLNPKGGETFTPGNVATIEWQEIQSHETLNWDILFSGDGGITWDIVIEDLPVDTRNYTWTLPDITTSKGQIKIIQDNVGMDYEDVSQYFTISSVTGIVTQVESKKINFYPNPLTEFATLEYDNPGHEPFTLTLYNIRGQIMRQVPDITADQVRIEKRDLADGFYIFQLKSNKEIYSIGNFIVQ